MIKEINDRFGSTHSLGSVKARRYVAFASVLLGVVCLSFCFIQCSLQVVRPLHGPALSRLLTDMIIVPLWSSTRQLWDTSVFAVRWQPSSGQLTVHVDGSSHPYEDLVIHFPN
jgi:hypothetical protein